jgi:hypothetical protein
MNIAVPDIDQLRLGDAAAAYPELVHSLREGTLVPYLGPGLAELANAEVPTSAEALAAFFGTKVALPRRAKGNAWAAAQHIESTKHRSTVTTLMAQAFEPVVAPTALHRFLASLPLPLIVDAWYDGAMRAALAERSDWGEIQGNTRAGIGEDRWYRFYDSKGAEVDRTSAKAWTTLLYKPHGGIAPAKNFLISDADYVEVLTEIDIQTPIPDEVRHRRTDRSFLFLGCRFNDQLLRTYARQITKRSATRHYVVVEPDALSRNELRFFASYGLVPIVAPLPEVAEALLAVA